MEIKIHEKKSDFCLIFIPVDVGIFLSFMGKSKILLLLITMPIQRISDLNLTFIKYYHRKNWDSIGVPEIKERKSCNSLNQISIQRIHNEKGNWDIKAEKVLVKYIIYNTYLKKKFLLVCNFL